MNTYLIYNDKSWALVRAEDSDSARAIAGKAVPGRPINIADAEAEKIAQTLGDHKFLGYLQAQPPVSVVYCEIEVDSFGKLELMLEKADWCKGYRIDSVALGVALDASKCDGQWLYDQFVGHSKLAHTHWERLSKVYRDIWNDFALYLRARGLK